MKRPMLTTRSRVHLVVFALCVLSVGCFPRPADEDDTLEDSGGVTDSVPEAGSGPSQDTTGTETVEAVDGLSVETEEDGGGDCGGCSHLDGPCSHGVCTSGRCQAVIDVGASCDDGDDCTLDDTCLPAGTCAGGAQLETMQRAWRRQRAQSVRPR